jgi:hypothetical protein
LAAQKPVSQQIQSMNDQINMVKQLLIKAKKLKDDLKYDISCVNDEIDNYIELIGKQFVLDTL